MSRLVENALFWDLDLKPECSQCHACALIIPLSATVSAKCSWPSPYCVILDNLPYSTPSALLVQCMHFPVLYMPFSEPMSFSPSMCLFSWLNPLFSRPSDTPTPVPSLVWDALFYEPSCCGQWLWSPGGIFLSLSWLTSRVVPSAEFTREHFLAGDGQAFLQQPCPLWRMSDQVCGPAIQIYNLLEAAHMTVTFALSCIYSHPYSLFSLSKEALASDILRLFSPYNSGNAGHDFAIQIDNDIYFVDNS